VGDLDRERRKSEGVWIAKDTKGRERRESGGIWIAKGAKGRERRKSEGVWIAKDTKGRERRDTKARRSESEAAKALWLPKVDPAQAGLAASGSQ
jgi:hypothetical protein